MMTRRNYVNVLLLTLGALTVTVLAVGCSPRADDNAEGTGEEVQVAFDPLAISGVRELGAEATRGLRPEFSWTSADGAAVYVLVVQTRSGEPYWAWRGAATRVYLGGETRIPDDKTGPVLAGAARWQVTAFDGSGRIIAASRWQTVSP